jgi:hypothetical protein
MALKRNRPLEISPLDDPTAPFATPLHLATTTLREQPTAANQPPAFDSATVRTMLKSNEKLRELAILSEILQPPLALRRKGRAR